MYTVTTNVPPAERKMLRDRQRPENGLAGLLEISWRVPISNRTSRVGWSNLQDALKPFVSVTMAKQLFILLLTTLLVSSFNAEEDNDQCGVYLAESSTSSAEEPKWGIYAGKDIGTNERIGYGDVGINTHHMEANALTGGYDEEYLTSIVEYFENYIWIPHPVGGQFEMEEGKLVTAIPGAGSLSAYNPKMTNADWNHSIPHVREAWNEESKKAHPGRGAYSNFFEATVYSTTKIPAGMEIFISYGENYEEENKVDDDELNKADLNKVDKTIDKLIQFFEKHKDELDETSKMEVYQFLIRDVMQAAAGTEKGKTIEKMLPTSPDDLVNIRQAGGLLKVYKPSMERSIEWLEQNGLCMDNIRPGPSTIKHAGRGAFATRKIPEGGLVAPVPLVQIPDKDVMQMYDVTLKYDEETEEEYHVRGDKDSPVGTQLLLNYCYGHPESNMLFFPAGAVASFINHSPRPNAKLVWSTHPSNSKHWFDLSPEQLINDDNRYLGLMMEVVATTDIEEGEEVFIDYGNLWQEAWQRHLSNWEQGKKFRKIKKSWPVRALDLTQQYKNKPLSQKIPENILTKCFLVISKEVGEESANENGEKIRVWTEHKTRHTFESANLFDCSILEREEDKNGESQYTISWTDDEDGSKTIVKHVPRRAIVFVDKENTGDQFTEMAFRHYIQIPDDIFPVGPWRDVDTEDDEE